jgi:DNA-binding GntR family transcriptional regulator
MSTAPMRSRLRLALGLQGAAEWPIPSEAQIQQEFGLARETARKAVALLREEGWVATVPGMGIYVRKR